jgi:hypothetical protein
LYTHLHFNTPTLYRPKILPQTQLQHPTQTGGGPTPSTATTQVIDLTRHTTELISNIENVVYPSHTETVGILEIATQLATIQPWRPLHHLPTWKSQHPLEINLPLEFTTVLSTAFNQPPGTVLAYLKHQRAANVTCSNMRDLISHGGLTNDSIMNTFLAVLCHQCQVYYLSTFFMYLLKRNKSWSSVQNCFATSTAQDMSSPTANSDAPILIPCHVNGMHWVALVHRLINNQVHFFYADDLNHSDTERNIKQLLVTYADRQFYPTNSVWVSCTSTTYRPQSNECGPRALFTLMVLGLHPDPSAQMLLPFMTNNLVQILRTWVASTILQGSAIIPPFPPSTTRISSSPSNTSIPAYLFPWNNSSTSTPSSPNTLIQPTQLAKRQKWKPKSHTTGPKNAAATTRVVAFHPGTSIEFSHKQRLHSQASLQPIPPHYPQHFGNKGTDNPSSQPPRTNIGIQRTLYDAFHLVPPETPGEYPDVWGHDPVSLEGDSTLGILFSNPKGLKLTYDILETEHSLGRVHSLGVGVLALAETNVNWNHPSVQARFHSSIRKVWKHSAVSKFSTKDHFTTETQPGGTLTMTCGNWTSRIIEKGVDPFGLGRWSYLVLRGKGATKLLIVTAYRVCRQTIRSAGPKTSTSQQFCLLSQSFWEAGLDDDPIPRHQFIVDLQAWLEHKIEAGYHIVLGVDANEAYHGNGGVFTPVTYQLESPIPIKGHDGTLATLVQSCGLVDPLLCHRPDSPPPETYNRGSDQIDFIFVSASLFDKVSRSGIFPYNSIFLCDHRPCYIDLDSKFLFLETTPTIDPPQYRGLCLEDPR